MLLEKQRHQHAFKTAGGLLVLLWTETTTSPHTLNCIVAAAGPWCIGIKMEALKTVLIDLKESFPCVLSYLEPDPEELCAFTKLYGSLRLLLSFQMKDSRFFSLDRCICVEAFLRTFSLANAGINIYLKFKYNKETIQRVFSAKMKSKIAWPHQPSLVLDVTSNTQPPESVNKGCWCHGGHPVIGGRLHVSIPPEAMDQGLFGDLSIQPVTFLSPCVLQYPYLETKLTHIQVMVFNPSNVPVSGLSNFFQTLPAHLDCQDLGLQGIHCSSSNDLVHNGCAVYKVEQEQESSLPSMQQSLLLFLLLQHKNPFACQLSDVIATELLIEHHLEGILNNNRQAITTALQGELKKTLEARNRRKKEQEKLRLAVEVILSSSITIVSCSSNMDFRYACLKSMKVLSTHDLLVSLQESLRNVMAWKFIPKGKCFSAQVEE